MGFTLTDSLENSAGNAKAELLHLLVVPDFVAHKDQPLCTAKFDLSISKSMQVGSVSITPGTKAELRVDTSSGDDLFDDDDFNAPTVIPDKTAYVGLSLTGSLDAGPSVTAGDLTFGINLGSSVTLNYLKAFSTADNPPTLATATEQTLTAFIIPTSIADFEKLGLDDVCSISGEGCLQISGSASVSLPVNPLASIALPLGVGTITVQDGLVTGLSSTFTLTGSYEVRVQKTSDGTILLSYIRERDTHFEVDASGSAGVSVKLNDTDLLAKVLGGFEKGGVDPKTLASLSSDEVSDFNDALKCGLDHSLAASLTLAMSTEADKSIAFQYELKPEDFDDASTAAVTRALRGDLTLLNTSMAGVQLLNSLTSDAEKHGASLKVNLLGIVNLITMSQLLNKCEFLFEPTSGDLTIKETAQSEKISAITDPARKQDALQNALFDSVLVTTTYVTGGTVSIPSLRCEAVHFTADRNTDMSQFADYANWFSVLHLLTSEEKTALVSQFRSGGDSRCTLRIQLNDANCRSLFQQGSNYAEIGRQALKVLLNADNPVDQVRLQMLSDPALWSKALETGPSPQLRDIIPLSPSDPAFQLVLAAVTGDVYDIAWWSDSMQKVVLLLTSDRNKLQQAMVAMVKNSKMRFDKPWGLVCLYLAAGQAGASGQLIAQGVALDKSAQPPLSATA